MQTGEPLTTAFRHHLWANLTLFEACRVLNDEQLDTDLEGTYGSIRATLEHITKSEQSYFSRISTGEPFQRPEDEPPMAIPAMMAILQQTGEGLIELAPKIGADDMVEVLWAGEPRQVPKSVILTQVLDHGCDHRSQIKTIMTQVGVEPPDLQSWAYFNQLDK